MQINIQACNFPLTDLSLLFIICFNSKNVPGGSW
jgi:hypothetical protein